MSAAHENASSSAEATPAGSTLAGQSLMPTSSSTPVEPSSRTRRRRGAGPHAGVAAAFLAPNLLLVLVFLVLPLLWALWISLHKMESLGPAQFLWFNNFLDLARDRDFWGALWNTVVFTALTVPTGMAIGLAVAVLMNSVLPGRTFYRTVVFLPLVISGISTGLMGAWLFDQNNGFVNEFLGAIGVSSPQWQSNGRWAMVSLVLVTLWVRIGFNMLIYLAGLQSIDPQLHEAAAIDGASPWQRFRYITWPALGPSTFFLVIMDLIYSFQVFDTVFAMTGGGPGNATTTLVTYAYQVGFDEHGMGQLGYAAAVGIVIYALTALVALVQWRFNRSSDES